MAEGNWSVIRVEKISAEGAQKTERHNERKNESYANINVDTEQIARNIHFKDTGGLTYNEYFQRLIDEGKISTRGQKAGATIFNELVVDVNTRYRIIISFAVSCIFPPFRNSGLSREFPKAISIS